MRKLKVFCCTHAGRHEVMVAATSRTRAAELMDMTHHELKTYGHEANDKDEAVAMASPGAVFFKEDGLASTGDWVLLRPAPAGSQAEGKA